MIHISPCISDLFFYLFIKGSIWSDLIDLSYLVFYPFRGATFISDDLVFTQPDQHRKAHVIYRYALRLWEKEQWTKERSWFPQVVKYHQCLQVPLLVPRRKVCVYFVLNLVSHGACRTGKDINYLCWSPCNSVCFWHHKTVYLSTYLLMKSYLMTQAKEIELVEEVARHILLVGVALSSLVRLWQQCCPSSWGPHGNISIYIHYIMF